MHVCSCHSCVLRLGHSAYLYGRPVLLLEQLQSSLAVGGCWLMSIQQLAQQLPATSQAL